MSHSIGAAHDPSRSPRSLTLLGTGGDTSPRSAQEDMKGLPEIAYGDG